MITTTAGLIRRPGLRRPGRQVRLLARLGKGAVVRFGVLVLLLLAWQWATRNAGNLFFPSPTEILDRILADWFSGPPTHLFVTSAFMADVAPSVGRTLAGWLLGSLIGVVVGVLAGSARTARQIIDPPAQFLRALPTPAVVPVFLLLFGASTGMRVALIAFGCVWPVLLNTMTAAASVDPRLRLTARALHLSRWRRLAQVALPSSAPAIAAGMRIGIALALILMVLSEWVVATSGLGFNLITAQQHFDMTGMWAAMALLAIVGYLINTVFLSVESRLLHWHKGVRGK
ncbi:ABC transporter permease [Streptomyces sp. RLB1-33]|nr:ABC transporter permease [Streptomyces sp. RLB1-33]QIY76442.1 ABC transporter permease [Streptomyces sp. RLB1-33]